MALPLRSLLWIDGVGGFVVLTGATVAIGAGTGWNAQSPDLPLFGAVSSRQAVLVRDRETGTEGADAAYVRDGRLASYVFKRTGQAAFRDAGVNALLRYARGDRGSGTVRRVEAPEVLNPIDEGLGNTNNAAQSGLEAIAMASVPLWMPISMPIATA